MRSFVLIICVGMTFANNCTRNQHVVNNKCVNCGENSYKDAGDDPTAGDTACFCDGVIDDCGNCGGDNSRCNCILGSNDHCTFDEMFKPYYGKNDTDCDCVPDSCDSAPKNSQVGSLSDCKSDKNKTNDDTLTQIAVIGTLLAVIILAFVFRNSCCSTLCESGEEYEERQRRNAADRKKIKELTSEREALLNSTKLQEEKTKLYF